MAMKLVLFSKSLTAGTKWILLIFITGLAACSVSKTNSATGKAVNNQSEAFQAPVIGNWKIADVQLIRSPYPISVEAKEKYVHMLKSNGRMQFAADSTYLMTGMENADIGTWQIKRDEGIILLMKHSGSVDTLQVAELTWQKLKGELRTHQHAGLTVELTRIP